MPGNRHRVPCLITDGGAASISRSLAREGVRVFGADYRKPFLGPRLPWMERLVVHPPPHGPGEMVEYLLSALQETGSGVLIPGSTAMNRLVVANASSFRDVAGFLLPTEQAFNVAFDRLATVRAARRAGVPAPETHPFGDPGDIEDFPAITKPRYERGGARGLRLIRSREEAEIAYREAERSGPLIVQEYIPGSSRQMRACGLLFDRDSRLRAFFALSKVREDPPTGGVTLAGVSIRDPGLATMAERLLSGISWTGVAELEFKVDPRDGLPKLMEINPRFWAYLWFCVACGVNFPYLLYRLCLGEEFDAVSDYPAGIGYINLGRKPLRSLGSVFQLPLRGMVVDHLPYRDPALAEWTIRALRRRLRPGHRRRGN